MTEKFNGYVNLNAAIQEIVEHHVKYAVAAAVESALKEAENQWLVNPPTVDEKPAPAAEKAEEGIPSEAAVLQALTYVAHNEGREKAKLFLSKYVPSGQKVVLSNLPKDKRRALLTDIELENEVPY